MLASSIQPFIFSRAVLCQAPTCPAFDESLLTYREDCEQHFLSLVINESWLSLLDTALGDNYFPHNKHDKKVFAKQVEKQSQ